MSDTTNGSNLDDSFARLVRRIDPRATLLRHWPLTGGVSAQVTALEVEWPDGRREKLVVRRHGAVDLASNPNVAADEFDLLRVLHAEGLPVPTPHYVDTERDLFPTPCLVIGFIDGSTDFAPASTNDVVDVLATQLARIHRIDLDREALSFLPSQSERCTQRLAEPRPAPDDGLNEGRTRRILASAWPRPSRNRPVLLHGDFWPGNTLWRDSQLTGIIDWEDAALGDPLADLANSRLEILLEFDANAMQRFTERYLTLNPIDVTDLPYWELCASLRPIAGLPNWGLDDATLRAMRAGLKRFIEQALDVLRA